MMTPLKERYVNPLTDFGFKKLFGSEPNKILLVDLLNQILPKHHHIKTLSYATNEQVGRMRTDRRAIFDLYCTADSGERFIVELQKVKQNFFKERSVYYATFPIQEQAEKGQWDFRLEPVYLLGILDFVFDENKSNAEVLHTVKLKNQHGRVFYDKLTFLYIELPKFTKREAELETHFDKWLYLLRHLPDLKEASSTFQESPFQHLFSVAQLTQFTREEHRAYEQSLKYYRDLRNSLDTSKSEGFQEGLAVGEQKGREEGREEGITIGEKKGREEGITIGEKKGREEGITIGEKKGREEGRAAEKERTAIALLRNQVPMEVIEQATGLTAQQIHAIKKKYRL